MYWQQKKEIESRETRGRERGLGGERERQNERARDREGREKRKGGGRREGEGGNERGISGRRRSRILLAVSV